MRVPDDDEVLADGRGALARPLRTSRSPPRAALTARLRVLWIRPLRGLRTRQAVGGRAASPG